MSVVGPRPEDIINADKLYIGNYRKILTVKPGLTSPASLYDYTHGEMYENERDYESIFLPEKLKLELYYVNHRSFVYDMHIILKTAYDIIAKICGKTNFATPKELVI
ncbi:MAG: sugar transferase, partial [Muribaculaceae bacterium]|nr:sugar transferase [Muribaculaceae bacterium]